MLRSLLPVFRAVLSIQTSRCENDVRMQLVFTSGLVQPHAVGKLGAVMWLKNVGVGCERHLCIKISMAA